MPAEVAKQEGSAVGDDPLATSAAIGHHAFIGSTGRDIGL
jgi:hypothetical protein